MGAEQIGADFSKMNRIEERIRTLDQTLDASNYSQQKCNLKNELEQFLVSLEPAKNVYIALPDDLRKFLIFKEKHGRTKLHNQGMLVQIRGSLVK